MKKKMKQMKLDVLKLGLSLGISFGLGAILLGIVSWLWGLGSSIVLIVSSLYYGYTNTLVGSLIGGIWAFLDGFIFGVVVAWLYNKLP